MITETFHILVEQEVQKISSFAYEDMLLEEVDLQANKAFYDWLDSFAEFQERGNRMDDTEARLNDIRTLVVRDSPLSLVVEGSVSVASLPDNYLYLVGAKMDILYECIKLRATSIVANVPYILKSGSLNYNSIAYVAGDLVQGNVNQALGKSDILYPLTTLMRYGRIVRNEEVYQLEDHYYGKSSYRSPVVYVAEGNINVQTNGFFVQNLEIVYIRKPNPVDSSQPSQLIDLPENGAYKLVTKTAEIIMKATEQSQQKIENLKLTK